MRRLPDAEFLADGLSPAQVTGLVDRVLRWADSISDSPSSS
ncbi:MAG: hypothetical protein ACRCSN_19030 [Dermatophilaceae bacterium]